MTAQEAKEQAVRLALKLFGAALVRRGDRVWALFPDGGEMAISLSDSHETLWHDALDVLQAVEARKVRRRDMVVATFKYWMGIQG